MAKKKNNYKAVSFRCDPLEWEELQNNINCSISEFLRQCISKQNKKSDKITELRKKLIELENDKKLIEMEIKDIKQAIYEQENLLNDNANDINLIYNKMDIIKKVAENENGITEKRIKTIANDEIKPYILINEAKKQGIKIIDKDKQTNSKIINKNESKPETSNDNLNTIIRLMNRNYKSQQGKYKNRLNYLESNKEHYKTMCENKGINFNDLLNHVKNNNDNEKE